MTVHFDETTSNILGSPRINEMGTPNSEGGGGYTSPTTLKIRHVSGQKRENHILVMLPEPGEHNHLEELKARFHKLIEWMDSAQERFGVITVFRVGGHKHRERNAEEENAYSELLTTFRRTQRSRINRQVTGYASVYDVELSPAVWERLNQRAARYAAYQFGVRGALFRNIEAAKDWLNEVADLEPLALDKAIPGTDFYVKTAILYGSTGGTTELIAEKVQAAWQASQNELLPLFNVGDWLDLSALAHYEKLLIGVPTWNIGKLQDDWEFHYPMLDQVDLTGKQFAIFGVGDQVNYPENFQDAVGILGEKIIAQGGRLVGYTSTEGYLHTFSRAQRGHQFMGLAIDDLNQPELTDERIAAWVQQVAQAFDEEFLMEVV
ncbi:MAG: hypothetical protein Fur0022_47940 [Anaerolineales bacterium]